jgi:antitoxin ParD1/3/4
MTTVKIAVSLPRELVDDAKRAVRRKAAKSVSAYVAEALRQKQRDEDFKAVLDQMFAETGGPPTKAELRWAKEQFHPPKKLKSRARK